MKEKKETKEEVQQNNSVELSDEQLQKVTGGKIREPEQREVN